MPWLAFIGALGIASGVKPRQSGPFWPDVVVYYFCCITGDQTNFVSGEKTAHTALKKFKQFHKHVSRRSYKNWIEFANGVTKNTMNELKNAGRRIDEKSNCTLRKFGNSQESPVCFLSNNLTWALSCVLAPLFGYYCAYSNSLEIFIRLFLSCHWFQVRIWKKVQCQNHPQILWN